MIACACFYLKVNLLMDLMLSYGTIILFGVSYSKLNTFH